mmetsp:Transcript_25291/g.64314  ORF Transcript_25291/g.64314 Transcript_25291/m.64314 type:complete len:385 (+) Transcript_25291:1747-2901(+)
MQVEKVPSLHLLHLVEAGIVVGQAVQVAGAAAAVAQVAVATAQVAGVRADAAVVHLSAWQVVEEAGVHLVPALSTLATTVAITSAVPPRARPERAVPALVAGVRHVVEDDVHEHLDAGRAARLHHVGKLRLAARARVQAVGDRLVLRPPVGARDVLGDRRDLHRIDAIRRQPLLALPGNVVVVPLPELDVDGRAGRGAVLAAGHLLVLAERAEDLHLLRAARRRLLRRGVTAHLVLDEPEPLPAVDHGGLRQHGAVVAHREEVAGGSLECDGAGGVVADQVIHLIYTDGVRCRRQSTTGDLGHELLRGHATEGHLAARLLHKLEAGGDGRHRAIGRHLHRGATQHAVLAHADERVPPGPEGNGALLSVLRPSRRAHVREGAAVP